MNFQSFWPKSSIAEWSNAFKILWIGSLKLLVKRLNLIHNICQIRTLKFTLTLGKELCTREKTQKEVDKYFLKENKAKANLAVNHSFCTKQFAMECV